jgi:hypothetical protein
VRFIREKCGDEISRFIEKKLESSKFPAKSMELIRKAVDCLEAISFSDAEQYIQDACKLMEKAVGENE